MRTVLIMRHGKSKWNEEGVDDHDRSLARRGKRDSQRMGAEMRARGLLPDIILSSTAKRARSTARRVAKALGYGGDILYEPGLYFNGLGPYLEALSHLPEDVHVAMLIGHNPLLEELIEALTCQRVRFPTAALACIDLPIGTWAELDESVEGTMRTLFYPRELARG